MRLLADDDDLVARARPLARERLRVLVRARAREEVAVPEQNAHRGFLAGATEEPSRADPSVVLDQGVVVPDVCVIALNAFAIPLPYHEL